MPAPFFKKHLVALLCLLLVLGTAALYWPISHHQFIFFDDGDYITDNNHVTTGLSWTNAVWAFDGAHSANWHPLTWISHQTDCTLFGVDAGRHHLMNLVFHIANTLLVFGFFLFTTNAPWRSAIVAALFAWHPLHVESVAWAAERKDVLCAFFWLLTLLAYAKYATTNPSREASSSLSRSGRLIYATLFYFVALVFFALGLMSKPMAVTLPFVLLLLDVWPCQRVFANAEKKIEVRNLLKLAAEKIPFFLLAAGGCVMTMRAQAEAGAVSPVELSSRLMNALQAYPRYIAKLFWPSDLAIVYPYRYHWPPGALVGAILLLLSISFLAVKFLRSAPWVFSGWFWFLGTLVPTIGIIQVGAAALADRYTYLPSIGFFAMLVWTGAELFANKSSGKTTLGLAGVTALFACIWTTSLQISYWRDSESLFLHSLATTKNNYVVENCLGKTYEKAGRSDRALVLYTDAVQMEPRFPQSQFNLALCLLAYGKTNEALEHLRVTAHLERRDADIQYALGFYFSQHGASEDAARAYNNALAVRPDFTEAQSALATMLTRQKKFAEAIPHFGTVVRLKPNDPEARFNLGLALLDNRQPAEAAKHFQEELRLSPNETKAHFRLAQAFELQGKFEDAVLHYREALRLKPDFAEANASLDAIFAAHPELKAQP